MRRRIASMTSLGSSASPASTVLSDPAQIAISVVTIAYENVDGLRATIASAIDQLKPGDEIVVVDGGSTDGTREWLQDVATVAPAVRFVSEPDGGIYDAMNKGVQLARGDVIVFMNSGDRFSSLDVLGITRDWFQSPATLWGFGAAQLVAPTGEILGKHSLKPPAAIRFIAGICTVPHQAAYFRTGFLEEVGPFSLTCGPSADQELMLRAWMRSPPLVTTETLALFDAGGISSERAFGAFAKQMATHRSENFPRLPKVVNGVLEGVGLLAECARWLRERIRSLLGRTAH